MYINILSALFDCVVVHKESCLKSPLPVNSIAQILAATHVEHQERALKIVLREQVTEVNAFTNTYKTENAAYNFSFH